MSAVPPGGSWVIGEFPSPNRLNRKTFTHVPGSSVASLTTIPNMAVIVTQDGGTFTKDQFIIRNSDNTAWLSSTAGKHTHNADSDSAGGLLSEINYFNITVAYKISLPSPSLGDFAKLGSANATDDSSVGRINITTTGASTYAHLGKHGVPISFTRRNRFLWKGFVTDGNNLTARVGVGAEDANSSPASGYPCYGMEICDTTGSDRDWDAFSGSGTARSAEATTGGTSVQRSTPAMYRWDFTPGQNVIMYVNNVAVKTKSTNIPSGSGSFTLSRGINNVGFGVKTATSTNKSMYCYGLAFEGTGSDSAWTST